MRSRIAKHDDRGAALVLVMVIVTVISLGLLGLLSLSDTSIRTTERLREQASASYAADAAGQVAVDQIRRDTFNNAAGSCSTTNGSTEVLSNFYAATGNAPSASAAVRCTPDPSYGTDGGGSNSSPGSALLTLGTGAGGEHGIYVDDTENRRGKDPATIPNHGTSFDAPAGPSSVGIAPTCTNNKVYELQPGLYSSVTALNTLTNAANCSKSVFHFNPGTYYFDFKDPGSHEWVISGGYLVGGTATSTLTVSPAPTMPGSCVPPRSAAATTTSGVQFVFGGNSRLFSTKSGSDASHIELCASNTDSGTGGGPPIAVYGLKQSVGSGSMAVSAQSGCITASGYTMTGGDSTHCAVIKSDNDPTPQLIIWGTNYTPLSMIDLYLNNNTVQVFRWGLVSRGIRLSSSGSPHDALDNPVIDVPGRRTATVRTAESGLPRRVRLPRLVDLQHVRHGPAPGEGVGVAAPADDGDGAQLVETVSGR